MAHFFQIKELSCGYPKKFMLNDVEFDIPKGTLAGIIGPNGSGKTTLFRGITGDVKIDKGTITLKGDNVTSMGIKERACNMAIVTQHIEGADITVEDYVLMGRLPYRKPFSFFEPKEDFELAEKYMKLTDVYQHKDKRMNELSGGEQQLASIARALTQEPQLLLLDEPTSHLDITHQVQVLNLIQELNEKLNLTVLMIIHDLNLASEYCDYLIMMKKGKLFKKGLPNEVLTYEHIEEVYQTSVITQINPISKKPAIFLLSKKILKDGLPKEN